MAYPSLSHCPASALSSIRPSLMSDPTGEGEEVNDLVQRVSPPVVSVSLATRSR